MGLKTWFLSPQKSQAIIRPPSAEELHSSPISNYTPNNREMWKESGRERAAITDGRGAESATRQQNHGRAPSAVRVLQCGCEGGTLNLSEKG